MFTDIDNIVSVLRITDSYWYFHCSYWLLLLVMMLTDDFAEGPENYWYLLSFTVNFEIVFQNNAF